MQAAGIGSIGADLRRLVVGGLLSALVLALVLAGGRALPPLDGFASVLSSDGAPPAAVPSEREILDRVAGAPVGFVANAGQADDSVSHLAQGPGYAFAFRGDGVRVSLVKQADARTAAKGAGAAAALSVGLEFVGANPDARAELAGRPGGRVDYLVGDRASWRAGLAAYPELVYRDLWPGIDMAFKGSGGKLKYEFRVAAGADPSQIQLAYSGAESLALSAGGALQVKTERGVLKDATPVSYQRADGRRVPVESSFALANGNGYGFATGGYDHSRPLVIDPAIEYSTYLGGPGPDSGLDVVVRGRDAWVSGATASPNFPSTGNAYDPTFNGSQEAFLAKLDTRKSGAASLEYSTFLGGGGPDAALGLVVQGHDVFLTGFTASPNFPVTPSAYDPSANGGGDAFVTRIDTRRGTAGLEYSTYLGGTTPTAPDLGLGIDVRGDDAYVTGTVGSADFPVSANAYDTTFNTGGIDGFVTRLDTGKSGAAGLEYSTFLGGGGPDSGRKVVVKGDDAFIAGPTGSPNFPVTGNAFDRSFNGGVLDAFVARLDTRKSGAAGLEYSTFLGGSGQEDTAQRPGTSIAVVGDHAYVASVTTSSDFPVTSNAYDRTHNGGQDAFVTRLDTKRKRAAGLRYSTYLGGSGDDIGRGVAATGRDVYVTGGTKSTDFPVSPKAFDVTPNGGQDAFVTGLDTRSRGGWGLEYSTYLGGSASEVSRGIAVWRGHAYVTGETGSPDFPVTAGAFQPVFGGAPPCEPAPGTQSPPAPQCDAFLTRLDTKSQLICPPGATDPRNCKKQRGHIPVRNRGTWVPVTCPQGAPGRCSGTVQVRTSDKRRFVLGRRRYQRIAAGSTRRVRVNLSKKGLRAVNRHLRRTVKRNKRLRVDVLVRGARGAPSGRLGTYTVRLRRR